MKGEVRNMNRQIVRDVLFLGGKSQPAERGDAAIARDLRDTLIANRERCAGLAANMIGERKRIIAFDCFGVPRVMLNPVILEKKGAYEAEESCLSLSGARKTTRYREIEVRYQDEKLNPHTERFFGWIAQVIQHECDHLEGILI